MTVDSRLRLAKGVSESSAGHCLSGCGRREVDLALSVLDQAKEPREGPGVGGIILSNAEAGSEKDGRAA